MAAATQVESERVGRYELAWGDEPPITLKRSSRVTNTAEATQADRRIATIRPRVASSPRQALGVGIGSRLPARSPTVAVADDSNREQAWIYLARRRWFGPVALVADMDDTASAQLRQQTVKAGVKAYVHSADQIILDLTPSLPGATPIIIHATVADSTLTMAIPQVVLGKAHGFAGITAVLVSLKLRIPPLGHGHDPLILAGKCTGHQFVVTSHFVYADRSRLTVRRASPCT